MDILQAKKLVIDAGHRLVENGLIARTWGNVSCRVSDTQFVITPSGMSYETLKPEDIVLINIADLEYEGDVKPSSEKGIHALAYRLRKEVNFIIHTHQVYASAVGALGIDLPIGEAASAAIGSVAPLASYGLPGTKKLRSGVETAVAANPASKAFLMTHHGALCLGTDFENSFLIAELLEKECESFIHAKSGTDSFAAAATKAFSLPSTAIKTACAKREGGKITFLPEGEKPELAAMFKEIFDARPEINFIEQSATPEIMAACSQGTLAPLLDDFAQIAGADVRCIEPTASAAKALKGRSAVLVKGHGVLCCGTSEYDAGAITMVLDKNCKTLVAQKLFGANEVIGGIDAKLMRFIYVKKYSKRAQA